MEIHGNSLCRFERDLFAFGSNLANSFRRQLRRLNLESSIPRNDHFSRISNVCLSFLGGIQSALPYVPASRVRAISHTPLVILQLAGRRSLLRFRVNVSAHHFNPNIGLGAFDPRIMSWRDRV